MTFLRSGSATDVGRVRSSNQDVALEESDLFAVADGMGGHVGGEVAARVAIDALRASFRKQPTVEGLRRSVAEANRDVWRKGQSETGLRGMGTTLTATALVRDPSGRQVIALANVGDSRAYVFSRGQVIQITADHSLAEERVRQGEMTEAEAAIHPHRHILTRALGVSSDVDVDLWELHLIDGDRILLCSDGLTNEVGDEEIGRILASTREPADAARSLVRAAVQHGGNDNVTVVVVDVVSADEGTGANESLSYEPAGGDQPGAELPTTAIPGLAPAGEAGASPSAKATDMTDAADVTGTSHPTDVTGVIPALGAAAAGTLNGRKSARAGASRTGASSVTGVVTATRPSGGPTANGAGNSDDPAGQSDAAEPGRHGDDGERDGAGATAGATAITDAAGVVDAAGPSGPGRSGPDRQGPSAGSAPSAGSTRPIRSTGTRTAPPGPSSTTVTRGVGRIGGTPPRPASAAPGAPAGAGPRRPSDFGSQAAELRRLRPSRRDRRHHRRMSGIPRMITVRVVLFVILLLAVVAAAYALVRWYAMDNWYVGIDNQHLAIYQGRPGGFLWFKPKLVDETSVTTSEILPFHLPAVRNHPQEPSLKAARHYVANLHKEFLATQPTATGGGTSAGGTGGTGGTSSSSTTTAAG